MCYTEVNTIGSEVDIYVDSFGGKNTGGMLLAGTPTKRGPARLGRSVRGFGGDLTEGPLESACGKYVNF